MTTNEMTLTSARARKVLGEYDHRINFPHSNDFAIIYGPNGVGKTKFLEIIHAMLRLDGRTLSKMPFEEATLHFSDTSVLHVRTHQSKANKTAGEKRRVGKSLRFELNHRGLEAEPWIYEGDGLEDWLLENTSWRPYDDEVWEDLRDGELAALQELEQRHPSSGRSGDPMPTPFRNFRRLVSSYLIETQRLRIERSPEGTRGMPYRSSPRRKHSSKITEHAAKMRSLVNDAQTEHSTITQQLDRTFPNRILEGSTTPREVEDVRRRYEEQNAFRSRLGRVASVALAEALSLPDRNLESWELRLLNLYLDDAATKLAPFEVLLQKIELLEDIVNARLLRKKLRVTAKDGLLVQHESENRSIDLDSLSSGEQHEIILMFDLLFNVPAGALVLIDEPEISLHVVWQLAFIPDVQRIADVAGFRFIVATHSPQIINDQWASATSLGPHEVPFT